MKAISLSLFGYNKERERNCFDFVSYLRGLLYHVRMNRLVFPDFEIVLQTDASTYNAYKKLFDQLPIKVNVNEPAPLCKAMLWRLKPVFDYNSYTHVICRDLDSPPTYREAQAVQDWINGDKAAHAITDSISHTIPMMGGMVGFHTGLWPVRTGWQHWADMFKDQKIDFSIKGSDQQLLNAIVYPKFANPPNESITQHYILGHGNTWLNGYKNYIPDIEVDNVPRELNESNDCCSHIGQAGWLLPQTGRLFRKYHNEKFKEIFEVEKKFPEVAYWVNDGTFN